MPRFQTPIFLARERRDADDLLRQLQEVRIAAEICEVAVGANRRGWQVLVAPADAQRARSIATVLEVQRYGDWESRPEPEAFWGVVEDENTLRDPTEIYSAQSVAQAHLLKNLLAEQGIMAMVSNQTLHGGAGIDLVGLPTAAKVVVPAEDAVAAREFALEFDARIREQRALVDAEPPAEEDAGWPTCPECGARRTTRCPICATSGTDFIEADRGFLGELAAAGENGATAQSCGCSGSCSAGADSAETCGSHPLLPDQEAEDHRRLLMCSVCDEPFEPAYPKHCEWCGHEFEDGYVIDEIVPPDQITGRAIAVVALLGLFLLAGVAYFMLILNR